MVTRLIVFLAAKKRWVLVGAIAIAAVVILSGNYGLYRLVEISYDRGKIEDEIRALQVEQQDLLDTRHKLETDLEYLEKIAREKYGMIRQGEEVFIVMPDAEK